MHRYFSGGLIGLALGMLWGGMCADKDTIHKPIYIKPDTLVQVKTQERIIHYAQADVPGIVEELNEYRTAPGWIDVRGDRIHAGLVAREWSIEYGIHRPRHSASIYAGGVFGLAYHYRINSWLYIGGGVFSDGISASVMAQW